MGEPNFLVPVALVAFLLAVAACFSLLEPRRAVLSTLLGGWLFLPHFDGRFRFSYLTTKAMFVPAAVLLGSVLFDSGSWRRFRPRLADLPMLILCLEPFATALSNDLGAKEGAAATLETLMSWGAPYLLARVYLGRRRGLEEFAVALAGAALLYVPLCLWEVRMSPQLHFALYGFRSWSFDQAYRLGGFRPSVFMQHGLAVGMFMSLGTLVAYWLWRTRSRGEVAGIPAGWAVAALVVTTVLCKSTGAIVLLAVGIAVLESAVRFRTAALVVALAALPPAYCAARITGWIPQVVIESAAAIEPDRAGSIQFRIENEQRLVQKAMIRPWLGWGRFGRSFLYDEDGRSLGAIVDSLWIIALGITGITGLVAIGAVLALPPLAFLRSFPGRRWGDPRLAPAAALAVGVLLWAVDDLLNAMIAPVFPAIAGALVSAVLATREPRARRQALKPAVGGSVNLGSPPTAQ
jgi:hypothetical protein